MEKRNLLKVLVGSRAHGLNNEDSDYDYRGVFVYPTKRLLELRPPKDQTNWIEGREDDTSWELHKFLLMATKCNPSVLEVFKSPIVEQKDDWGDRVQALFPFVWNTKDALNAFSGYSYNQRKKMLDDPHDVRARKYGLAYLRTLYNINTLLATGTFQMSVVDTPIEKTLRKWKEGDYSPGEVVDVCQEWQDRAYVLADTGPFKDKETNYDEVNKFLLEVRGEFNEA